MLYKELERMVQYMSGLRNSIVSVTRCVNYDNYNEVENSVKQAVGMIGGFEAIISPGDAVLIKPNLISPKPYTTGATTNPYIVKAIARLCKMSGAGKITIADGSAVGHNATEAFDICGMKQIAQEEGCSLVDFLKDEYQFVVNPCGKVFKRIRVPKTFIESNVVINVPVMKTHDALGVTLGLKNMKGIIHITDKKRFHKWGLAQSIVDLNHIALPELTIMDGTVAMEGNGPASGDPVGIGIIMASTDTVACDRVASEIMGFNEDEIEYIKMAGEQGLGCFELSDITVLGEKISDVARPFKRTVLNREKLKEMGINLVACDACSGCSHVVKNYLGNLEKSGRLEKLRGYTIIYGQSAKLPDDASDRVIRIGVCTRNLNGTDSIYIPGCPPHPLHIKEKLGEL